MKVINSEKYFEISDGNTSSTVFYLWLRDHCRCDSCYDHVTSQRKLDFTEIPFDIRPKSFSVHNREVLQVEWEDRHKSEYSIQWLKSLDYDHCMKNQRRNYAPWTSEEVMALPVAHVPFHGLLETEDAVRELVKSLLDYGVGFIENVPANIEATEEAVLRISHVQHTLFGGMWQFSDTMDHNDTAYTKEALGAHTDNTYFSQAAGLQILHCLGHDGDGGETLLVDGFKALEILEKLDPVVLERFSRVPTAAEYVETGHHHRYAAPLVKLNRITKQFEQIRFNLNDRAPVILHPRMILQYYEDMRMLTSIIKDPKLEWWFKLKPGTILIFDNFRVLHGRSKYSGHRKMCGCYIGRDDFLSKARVLGLLTTCSL